MPDAGLPIVGDDLVDLGARGLDAGQVRGRPERRFAQHAQDGAVGAFARRAAGAIGDGDELGIQRLEPADGQPQGVSPASGVFGGENSNETFERRSSPAAGARDRAQRAGASSTAVSCDAPWAFGGSLGASRS